MFLAIQLLHGVLQRRFAHIHCKAIDPRAVQQQAITAVTHQCQNCSIFFTRAHNVFCTPYNSRPLSEQALPLCCEGSTSMHQQAYMVLLTVG